MNGTHPAADLIERAFGIARQSGKSDWWTMRSPVLKNRLLLLTNHSFKESDFGATSFRDFLRKAGDIVSVDETSVPALVTLKSAKSTSLPDPERSPTNPVRPEYIRTDLWRALLDYSSGRKYLWDATEGVARPGTPGEAGLYLPTISVADLDEWRSSFVALHGPQDAEGSKRLQDWVKERLPTAALPPSTRPMWNRYLKFKVEDRLQHWFATNAISPPDIIEKKSEMPASDERVETLREFVIACVRAMSKQELSELRISPAIALRTLPIQGERGKE